MTGTGTPGPEPRKLLNAKGNRQPSREVNLITDDEAGTGTPGQAADEAPAGQWVVIVQPYCQQPTAYGPLSLAEAEQMLTEPRDDNEGRSAVMLRAVTAAAAAQPAPGDLVRQMAGLADEFDRNADQCREAMRNDPDEQSTARKAARASAYRACAVAVRHGLRASDGEQPAPEPAFPTAQAVLARVLEWFHPEGAYRDAHITRAQLAHAYQDGELDVPDELRKFL